MMKKKQFNLGLGARSKYDIKKIPSFQFTSALK